MGSWNQSPVDTKGQVYLYFAGTCFWYKLFHFYASEHLRICTYNFVVHKIWNGENYHSSVTGYGMKQNEWNLESQVIKFL